MKISIIITTKNEAEHLEELLKSIAIQTHKQYEIIVVDNNSSDNTTAIAKQYNARVFSCGPERSAQRNYGAKRARGEILVFLDADMQLTRRVCTELAQLYSNTAFLAAIIPEQSVGTGFWSACKIYERSCYLGVDWIESARSFRKSVFEALGGYDEGLTGPEDFDLPQRLKKRYGAGAVQRIQAQIIHNEGRIKLLEQFRKKFYYGRSMSRYLDKIENRVHLQQQANIFMRYRLFFSHSKFEMGTIHIVFGTVFLKTLELLALFLGSMAGRIR